MTVTLRRIPFSQFEREVIVTAVMTGQCPPELSELEEISLVIAERLPDLLKKAGHQDTSENRRKLIDLVLMRWGMPKHRISKSYRRYRNG